MEEEQTGTARKYLAALGKYDKLGQWEIVRQKCMKVANINIIAKSYIKPLSCVAPPPFQVKEKASPNCISQLPAPPSRQSDPERIWEVIAIASNV